MSKQELGDLLVSVYDRGKKQGVREAAVKLGLACVQWGTEGCTMTSHHSYKECGDGVEAPALG